MIVAILFVTLWVLASILPFAILALWGHYFLAAAALVVGLFNLRMIHNHYVIVCDMRIVNTEKRSVMIIRSPLRIISINMATIDSFEMIDSIIGNPCLMRTADRKAYWLANVNEEMRLMITDYVRTSG